MRKKRFVVAAMAGTCSLAMIFGVMSATASSGSNADPQSPTGIENAPEVSVRAGADPGVEDPHLAPIPFEVVNFTNHVQATLAGDSRYSAVEISEDRKSVKIWWFGDPSSQLNSILKEPAAGLLSVTVAQTRFLPGYITAAARELLAAGSAIGVSSVEVGPDAAALLVTMDSSDPVEHAKLLPQLQAMTSFPVVIAGGGGVAPATLGHEFEAKLITPSATWEIPCTCVAMPTSMPPHIEVRSQ